jgi:hypothetical protein
MKVNRFSILSLTFVFIILLSVPVSMGASNNAQVLTPPSLQIHSTYTYDNGEFYFSYLFSNANNTTAKVIINGIQVATFTVNEPNLSVMNFLANALLSIDNATGLYTLQLPYGSFGLGLKSEVVYLYDDGDVNTLYVNQTESPLAHAQQEFNNTISQWNQNITSLNNMITRTNAIALIAVAMIAFETVLFVSVAYILWKRGGNSGQKKRREK